MAADPGVARPPFRNSRSPGSGAEGEQLAKRRGVGFELLVAGDLQLQCAETLGARVGLAEHAQAE